MRPSSKRADLDADADPQRPAELRPSLALTWSRARSMARAARKRLAAAGLDAVVLAEDGEQAIAQELVDPAAVSCGSPRRRGEELVQNENDVVGQAALRELGEVAQVEEHDGERLLDAGRVRSCSSAASGPVLAGRSRRVTSSRLCRPDLAGEAHVGRRGDAGRA